MLNHLLRIWFSLKETLGASCFSFLGETVPEKSSTVGKAAGKLVRPVYGQHHRNHKLHKILSANMSEMLNYRCKQQNLQRI